MLLKKNSLTLFIASMLSLATLRYVALANSTTVQIEPSALSIPIGETFHVNVTISEVVNLTGWEFRLYYENTILTCTNIVEGPFLQSGGGTFHIFNITNNYNITHGRVLAACTLLGITSVTGNGTLATVTFQAIGGDQTPLNLDDTKLGDEKIPPEKIPHTAYDGTVEVTGADYDVAVIGILTSKTGCFPETLMQGQTTNINVTVENQGKFVETFNVTTYINTTEISRIPVTLNPGENRTIPFLWDTTPHGKGNYTVSAEVDTLPGETDTIDNTMDYGLVLLTIPGDVDGDRDVDIFDIVRMSSVYGISHPDPRYDPNSDWDEDGDIDIFDIVTATAQYGESW